ncbi:MAG: ABC transporter ATP-binding protein [Terrimicrobiaceae bacterium]
MPVITTEGLSKRYRLGVINRRYLYKDMQSFFARCLGRPDPHSEVDARVTHTREGIIWALDDVNFEIRDGDVVGVIGRNGSGKSTLLKILSRITSPTKGTARIKGRVASLLEVGTGFHQELTGRDNVFLNGSILGMPKEMIRAKFDEIVAFSGVEEYIDTPVKRYSSGMRVRLAFAVAAHLEPDILIVDEVLAVGDSSFQQKCLGRMTEAAQEGRTVLFVSHNAAAVENLCVRGIVLDQGRGVFEGTQTQALQFYAECCHSESGSLRERRDRGGTGALRIAEIDFRSFDGRVLKSVSSGQDVNVCLHFESHTNRTFPTLNARIHISNQFDLPIFMQHNGLSGDAFGPLPATGTFVCQIPRLPLPPGRYRVSFYVSSGYYRGADQLDYMIHAVDMNVDGGDFFGTGEVPLAGEGVCLVPARWRLEELTLARSNSATDPSSVR